MAKSIGRATLLKKNDVAIAGVRTKSISWSGESIDVTTNEDAGVRLLLAESAQEQIDIAFDGIEEDGVIRDIALAIGTSKMLTDITYELDNGDVISGDFRLSSYDRGNPYNDGTTFSATLESSGAWTVTPAP